MASQTLPAARPTRQLSLLDSTCIIVGVIIGAGIYETTPSVARAVNTGLELIAVWLVGGLVTLIGAMCYAELVAAYPQSGGDYQFLKHAFGLRLAYVFAWSELWIVRPASVGAIAFVFGRYFDATLPALRHLLPDGWPPSTVYAAAAVAVLSLTNLLGVRQGKYTQNVLTMAKVGGLLALVLTALLLPPSGAPLPPRADAGPLPWSLALIFVLFTYGGWNEIAYVGAEVRDPQRNALRALLVGTATVTLIYVMVNVAFLWTLGLDGIRHSQAVAADCLRSRLGEPGGRFISLLICISALGGVNGYLLAGARIYYAVGLDHSHFAPLGVWHPRWGTPHRALLLQGGVTLLLIGLFGTGAWNALAARCAALLRAEPPGSSGGFEQCVIFTTPVFWLFFLLVGVSLIALRLRQPHQPRPFRVPGYPVLPLLFCMSSAYMLYSSLMHAAANRSYEAWWAIGLLIPGVVLCFFSRPRQGTADA
jgi:APA family basic amino acid/polyamine antiporter